MREVGARTYNVLLGLGGEVELPVHVVVLTIGIISDVAETVCARIQVKSATRVNQSDHSEYLPLAPLRRFA